MKKSEFEEIEEEYLDGRKRLEDISVGDLVWEVAYRFGDIDYHPAIVKSVNVDEDRIKVIDVSDGNKEKEYVCFKTEKDMLYLGFTKKSFEEDYQEYAEIINKVKRGLI